MTTYYIDTAVGNDGNAGTSEGSGNAWATIQKGADSGTSGDNFYVKASGTYNEKVDFDTVGATGVVGARRNFIGYTTTPGDNGLVTISGGGSRTSCFDLNGSVDYVSA